ALLAPDPRRVHLAVEGIAQAAVDEADVSSVERIFQVLEVIATSPEGIRLQQAHRVLELRVARQGRRPERSSIAAVSPAEVGEDQPEILLAGITADPHLAGEAGVLGRLLHALAGLIVFPAVVEAADAVALDPAGRELRASVGAARVEEVNRWTR